MATSRQREDFTAYVYENDYEAMQKLVQQYPNIETGGDLFGLWQDENTVVIQLFIGPGKECRRTTTSFHQDVQYLERIGTVITKEEGLCNVGEWHSHHQIGMPEPSRQDNQTVLSNMPQLGLDRFVLFIANIKTPSVGKRSYNVSLENIKLNCFVFRSEVPRGQQPIRGKIVLIGGANPLTEQNKAKSKIEEGAEAVPIIGQEKGRKNDKKPRSSDEEMINPDENKSPNRDYGRAEAGPIIGQEKGRKNDKIPRSSDEEMINPDENKSPNRDYGRARSAQLTKTEVDPTPPSTQKVVKNVDRLSAKGFF